MKPALMFLVIFCGGLVASADKKSPPPTQVVVPDDVEFEPAKKPCQNDTECPPGQYCIKGACVAEKSADGGVPSDDPLVGAEEILGEKTDGGTKPPPAPEATPPANTCHNGKRDADESDVDCGIMCPRCANGKVCLGNVDCQSWWCGDDKKCAPLPPPPPAKPDTPPSVFKAEGEKCGQISDCAYGLSCVGGKCTTPPPPRKIPPKPAVGSLNEGDPCEKPTDCKSGLCVEQDGERHCRVRHGLPVVVDRTRDQRLGKPFPADDRTLADHRRARDGFGVVIRDPGNRIVDNHYNTRKPEDAEPYQTGLTGDRCTRLLPTSGIKLCGPSADSSIVGFGEAFEVPLWAFMRQLPPPPPPEPDCQLRKGPAGEVYKASDTINCWAPCAFNHTIPASDSAACKSPEPDCQLVKGPNGEALYKASDKRCVAPPSSEKSENFVHITLDAVTKARWSRVFFLHRWDEFLVGGGLGLGFELGHKAYFGTHLVVGTNGLEREILLSLDLQAGWRFHKAFMLVLDLTLDTRSLLQREAIGDILTRRSTNAGLALRIYPGAGSQSTWWHHLYLQAGCGGGWTTQPPDRGFANVACSGSFVQEIPLR